MSSSSVPVIRCWAGFENRVIGLGPGLAPVEIEAPIRGWPRLAGHGETLALLYDDLVELRDGLSGEVRHAIATPRAVGVHVASNRVWLDEQHSARPVTLDGQALDPVDLHGGTGLLTVADRWLATTRYEAHDFATVLVINTAGNKGPALTTRRLMNPRAAGIVADALVVAHDGGIELFPIDGQHSRLMHKPVNRLGLAAIVVPSRPAEDPREWYLFVEDVVAQSVVPIGPREGPFQRVDAAMTTANRLTRFSGDQPAASRVLDRRVVAAAVADSRILTLTSKQPAAADAGPAGPIQCTVLSDQLADVETVDFGDHEWRGGFTACSRSRAASDP